MTDFAVIDGKLQPKGPSDVGSVADQGLGRQLLGDDDALKKHKNQLWTQVHRVEDRQRPEMPVHKLDEDVQLVGLNIEALADDEYDAAEILFDPAAFEEPPLRASLDQFRMSQEELEPFVQIAAAQRQHYQEAGKQLQREEEMRHVGAEDEEARLCPELQRAFLEANNQQDGDQ